MLTIIQRLLLQLSKPWKCILTLTFTFGFWIILFQFGIPTSYKSFSIIDNTVRTLKPFDPSFWATSTSDLTVPTLCVVTRIYYAQVSYFLVLALALYHAHLQNIRIYLVNTDIRTDLAQLEQTVQFINQLVLRNDFVILLDLGKPSTEVDYGYRMTDRALTYLYQQHTNSPSTCQYVTFTNADNFYSRNFIKKILPYMKAGKDIIAWNFLSHHRKPEYQEHVDPKKKTTPEIVDDATEKCAVVALRLSRVDLGAVTYRLSFLQERNLYFWHPNRGYVFGSDGYFVEEAAKRTNSSILSRQTLFVHQ